DDWPSLARRSGTPSAGPVGLLGEEGRGFYQDGPFLLEHSHAPPEPDQLGPLLGRDTLLEAGLDIGLLGPAIDRAAAQTQFSRRTRDRTIGRAGKADGLLLELT